MKKIIIACLLVLLFPIRVNALELAPNAKSAILIDTNSKTILFEKNKDERLNVASLTKMMSQILILEAVEENRLSWDKMIKVSKNAASYGGSQIYLEPGEEMSARDLMKAVSMASANDATIALAEEIAGTEEKFVSMMNEKAHSLGLKNTMFSNPTGLDYDNNYSSSYDLSIIALELLKHESILEFSSLYEDYLREDTPNKFWLVNTNKLVRLYEGCDGLKTGYTDKALYTMAVTAKRNNLRLLSIVLGEKEGKVRNKEVVEILDYGFNNYKSSIIKKKGTVVDTVKEKKATKDIDIILSTDISILLKKEEKLKDYKEKIVLNKIKLPLKKNTNVGYLELYDQNKLIGKYNLVSKSNVDKNTFIKTFINNIKDTIIGSF